MGRLSRKRPCPISESGWPQLGPASAIALNGSFSAQLFRSSSGEMTFAIEGLYLTGSSRHPGGNITGAPGYNAAQIIARDLGIDLWWNPVDGRKLWSELAQAAVSARCTECDVHFACWIVGSNQPILDVRFPACNDRPKRPFRLRG